jgi:hypothetical protein
VRLAFPANTQQVAHAVSGGENSCDVGMGGWRAVRDWRLRSGDGRNPVGFVDRHTADDGVLVGLINIDIEATSVRGVGHDTTFLVEAAALKRRFATVVPRCSPGVSGRTGPGATGEIRLPNAGYCQRPNVIPSRGRARCQGGINSQFTTVPLLWTVHRDTTPAPPVSQDAAFVRRSRNGPSTCRVGQAGCRKRNGQRWIRGKGRSGPDP